MDFRARMEQQRRQSAEDCAHYLDKIAVFLEKEIISGKRAAEEQIRIIEQELEKAIKGSYATKFSKVVKNYRLYWSQWLYDKVASYCNESSTEQNKYGVLKSESLPPEVLRVIGKYGLRISRDCDTDCYSIDIPFPICEKTYQIEKSFFGSKYQFTMQISDYERKRQKHILTWAEKNRIKIVFNYLLKTKYSDGCTLTYDGNSWDYAPISGKVLPTKLSVDSKNGSFSFTLPYYKYDEVEHVVSCCEVEPTSIYCTMEL